MLRRVGNFTSVSPTRVVAALLAIRDWSIAIISRVDSSRMTVESNRIQSLPAAVWRLFLKLERCAIPLLERMSPETLGQLDDAAGTIIRESAARDMQTVLEARRIAAEVDATARETGVPVAVLKGGVRAITGADPLLPVVDLDILVRRDDLDRVAQSLASHGMGQPHREAVSALALHLTFPASDRRLTVELHWALSASARPLDGEIFSRIRPLGHGTSLATLHPADQLAHLVDHALFRHSDQSVTLRDSLLIGAAASECSEHEVENLLMRLDAAQKTVARDLLTFSRNLYLGFAQRSPDPMRESAARWYAAVVIVRRLPARFRSDSLLRYLSMAALGRSKAGATVRDALIYRGTSNRLLARIGRQFPRVGATITGVAHLAWYTALGSVIYPAIAITARRASRAHSYQPVNSLTR